jgi:TPR repeat protein
MQVIEKVRGVASRGLGRFSLLSRIAIVTLVCLVAGGLIFWLCNELVYYFIARSYAEELADAYDLNSHVTRAILWTSFAAIVVLAGYSFSFSKLRRRIGYAGLLTLVVGHSLVIGRIDANFRKSGEPEKCYVMTRTSIKTLNRVGIDPETGRECRPLTPQIVEKIAEYQSGHRPRQITVISPTFFDPTTGEPVVWYSRNDRDQIELFDLMGFHPQTGEELIPITPEVAKAWKEQAAKIVRRIPMRVDDPERFGFFDPTTGAAKVWYWRSASGDYEFYDGPGFHPRSGDPFKIVTQDMIADWRQQQEAEAARKKAELAAKKEATCKDEESKLEAILSRGSAGTAVDDLKKFSKTATCDRLGPVVVAAIDRFNAEAAQRERQAIDALRQRQQSAGDCDRLAANPTDKRWGGEGVSFEMLGHQADQAYAACTMAVAMFPAELRYQYQLGRAAQFKDKKQAFEIFSRLVQANYAAAFDNLGGMYFDRRDTAKAIELFERGRALGDADSMVSLVNLIDKGLFMTSYPEQTKLELLRRAAQLGHAGAQQGYELELQKAEQRRIEVETQRRALETFGRFMQGVPRW